MPIALIGYRGSGKTTIGKRLADRLWWPFVDLDEVIVARAGITIREIFAQRGEEHFRDLESQCLAESLKPADQVLALGGGAVLRPANRDRIKAAGCKVVYLRCDPAVLLRRIESDRTTADMRPSLTALGGGIEEITTLLAQREPIYRQVMTAELDVTNLTSDEAVAHIARMV
jgi:shikimate kinase